MTVLIIYRFLRLSIQHPRTNLVNMLIIVKITVSMMVVEMMTSRQKNRMIRVSEGVCINMKTGK